MLAAWNNHACDKQQRKHFLTFHLIQETTHPR